MNPALAAAMRVCPECGMEMINALDAPMLLRCSDSDCREAIWKLDFVAGWNAAAKAAAEVALITPARITTWSEAPSAINLRKDIATAIHALSDGDGG